MIQALLGRKLGMTRLFDENGVVTASTLVEAGPCFITQLRSLEVDGYTDSIGSDAYNEKLSLRRANAVKEYLQQHGVAASRMTVKGFGKSNPVASNATPEGRAQNRRVELVVNQ